MGASRRGVCQGARLHSDLRERELENCPLSIRLHELSLDAVRAREFAGEAQAEAGAGPSAV